MTFPNLIKLVALAAIAGLGGGFLWGVADRRSTEAAVDFADHHIRMPKTDEQALLVFSCGSSEPLVVYDLLTDDVLNNREKIGTHLTNSLNRTLQSDLFSHATAVAVEGFAVMFSYKDELKQWKLKQTSNRIAIIAGVAIPTAYLGYLASDWLRLECGSKALYERLAKKDFWRPHRFSAAKSFFDRNSYCIDRLATLPTAGDVTFRSLLRMDNASDAPMARKQEEMTNAVARWREYISPANQGLPEQALVESRYRQGGVRDFVRYGADHKVEATWGDSFHQRLYGEYQFTAADADFDKIDFRLMLSAEHQCSRLDPDKANSLYRTVDPLQDQNTSRFFERRRAIVKALDSLATQ